MDISQRRLGLAELQLEEIFTWATITVRYKPLSYEACLCYISVSFVRCVELCVSEAFEAKSGEG